MRRLARALLALLVGLLVFLILKVLFGQEDRRTPPYMRFLRLPSPHPVVYPRRSLL